MKVEKRKKLIINCIYYALLIGMIYLVIHYALPFFAPFILAFLVAWVLRAPSVALAHKIHFPEKIVSIIVVIIFYFLLLLGTFLLGAKLIMITKDLFFQLPDLFTNSIIPFINMFFQKLEEIAVKMNIEYTTTIESLYLQWVQSAEKGISDISLTALKMISVQLTSLPSLLLKLILMIISTFFFAADYGKLTGFVKRQLPQNVNAMMSLAKKYISGTVAIYLKSYSIILSITFAELFVGFLILGIKPAIVIAFVIAIMDILPIVGTGLILIPWGIVQLMLGNLPGGIGILVLYLVITIVRNTIEPRIVGKQIGLHPLVALISMFVGVKVAGVIGLFGFPIMMSFIMYLSRTGVLHVFKTEDETAPEASTSDTLQEKQEYK